VVDGATRVFAILGNPVRHSLSPRMQTAAFQTLGINAVYVPLACRREDVAGLVASISAAGGGGNVTIPYKAEAARAATHPSPAVQALGACNTFWGAHDECHADNTDVVGVAEALAELSAADGTWVVIGTGGAARAVAEVARERGVALAVRSRTPERAEAFNDHLAARGVPIGAEAEAHVAINATPLGLRESDPLPLAFEELPDLRTALDLVYRPGRTPWVRAARQRGLVAEDGRGMLVAQGAAGFRCWFPGVDPPVEMMRAVVERALE